MALISTEKTAIIGLVVAAYGAILATGNSVFQYLAHRRDGVDVVLTVRSNMRTNNRRYAGMVVTLITATNRGKRPVTISGFAAKKLDSRNYLYFSDVQPATPGQITESQFITAHIHESDDLKDIESYFVWDSAGRHFYNHIVPWYRRLLSRFRSRFFPVT